MTTAAKERGERRQIVPDRRPFVRLEPEIGAVELPASARRALPELEAALGSAVPALAVLLVDFAGRHGRVRPWREAPTMSVLNRRRRAARLWLTAIVAGRVDRAARQLAVRSLAQLAGTGPELRRALHFGRRCTEFLHGAATARIVSRPAANMVPQAKALHALQAVLAAHLGALELAARASDPAPI